MIKEKMYVRFPADIESINYPKIFMCAQVIKFDVFSKRVKLKIHDNDNILEYYDKLPNGCIDLDISRVNRCSFFRDSIVYKKGVEYTILSSAILNKETKYYEYYAKNNDTKQTVKISEDEVSASFTNGSVSPILQLMNFELQNPCWYFGRAVVSRCANVLDNAMYGFRELTGAKIFLLPHQVRTIMRCLHEMPCRYMLADEVGLGKTIEAISIYKIFIEDNFNTKALFVVPKTLVEQWKIELFFKFDIYPGENKGKNFVKVIATEDLNREYTSGKWDFVIFDEIHKYLNDYHYEILKKISENATNLLMLSATPIQDRKYEYLKLLQLLLPKKYSELQLGEFEKLLSKQKNVMQYADYIMDYIRDLEEEINEANDEDDVRENEDCQDLFDEIVDAMETVSSIIEDNKLRDLIDDVNFESDDFGLYAMRVFLSYLCGNYQIENNIIRNRRNAVKNIDDSTLLSTRELVSLPYNLIEEDNYYELTIYGLLKELVESSHEDLPDIKNIVSSYFSSAHAFNAEINKCRYNTSTLLELKTLANQWEYYENKILDDILEILDDPDNYPEYCESRILKILDFLYEETEDSKVVLFTSFPETFDYYKKMLEKIYHRSEVSFFGEIIDKNELELDVYSFQNNPECKIMLCDNSGGEGRNFQIADYIIHIDLPWDANLIEQRIGRLDRLERSENRPIVYSVVPYSKNTFEEALFTFWNEGINIFGESLSGLEIIMKDLNNEIVNAITKDFENGLFDIIPRINKLTENVKKALKKDQQYDVAAMVYNPMYIELSKTINYFNRNESELFANTMMSWASYSGFKGVVNKKNQVVFSANSFSPGSAYKALLVPPKWNNYLNQKQNAFLAHVKELYEKENHIRSNNRSIIGTFSRKCAIENDYIRFFSPGDEVFDCIVNNAMQSTKGTCSAFACPSNLIWKGFIFTWLVNPDETVLFNKNIPASAMSMYRNYLATNLIPVPVSLENYYDYSDKDIIKEYHRLINKGFNKTKTVYFGKRKREMKYLSQENDSMINIEWFIHKYNSTDWEDIIKDARNESFLKAERVVKENSNISGAKKEMQRVLSSREANADYYNLNADDLSALREVQDVVLKSISHPVLKLDSVSLIWMVNENE